MHRNGWEAQERLGHAPINIAEKECIVCGSRQGASAQVLDVGS